MPSRISAFATVLLLAGLGRAAEPVDYARQIKPLLKERCFACHGALKQQGKLRLDTAKAIVTGGRHGPAVKPADGAGSLLFQRISDSDESARMPPEGKPLTGEQVALLKSWIDQGAKAPADEALDEDPRAHWAFRPPVRPKATAATDRDWDRNPIDRLLFVEHQKRGLKPVAEADRATLLRRVTIDLVGLPPTRDELQAFLADTSPDAYEKVVDRLLASPRHGERWARHWMDVWRYSDWYGRRSVPDVLNSYGQIWRWRDWIVRSLNNDRGYDDMVRMMLAADEHVPGNDDEAVATGFLVRNFFRWNYNNWMRDNVEHTAKSFLGLTLNCCHCHDHKYDPVSQEEYFRFRAIFEPLEIRHERWPGEPDPGPYPKYSYGASYKPIASGMVRVMDEKLEAKTHFYSGGDERNVAKDKPPVAPGVPKALGGTFHAIPVTLPPVSWYPGLKAFVRQEELSKRHRTIQLVTELLAKTSPGAEAARLPEAQLAVALSDLAALEARIVADDVTHGRAPGDPSATGEVASRAEQRYRLDDALLELLQAEAALATARSASKPEAITAAEKARVAAQAKSDAACRALESPSTSYTPLSPIYPKTSTGRRSALARWLTNRDHPLTARVAVNHIWNWHFGRPLVETTNNFGRSGKAPSHPELLDWLAVELMDGGWNMKSLHRLIVTSRAYRMQSRLPAADTPNLKADPDNVWLWRYPMARVQAEVIRDGLLHLAGEFEGSMGGAEIAQTQVLESRRRSLYLAHHGETRAEFLDLFDAANPCDAYRRTTSVLPQQALALSNSELALRLARVVATRLGGTADSDEAFIRAAFEHVLTRPPREAESAAAVAFLKRQRELLATSGTEIKADLALRARENLVHVLFNHTDFVTVR